MGKYDPLATFLTQIPPTQNDIVLSFAQMEQVLGFALPNSALIHRAWWANEQNGQHSHARSWLLSIWEVDTVNQHDRWVRFRRQQ